MALQTWALPQLELLLPIDQESLKQIINQADSLGETEAGEYLSSLLGDSPAACDFITDFGSHRRKLSENPRQSNQSNVSNDSREAHPQSTPTMSSKQDIGNSNTTAPPYAPPSYPPPSQNRPASTNRPHTNQVIEAGKLRARDEQHMQNLLQNLQMQYGIYNSEIEPEHEADYYCMCPIHQYKQAKFGRLRVQNMWSEAVMYPGEKAYDDVYGQGLVMGNISRNPYRRRVISPYGMFQSQWGPQKPRADYHARSIHQTIDLNQTLNQEAQAKIDANEPKFNIWDDNDLNQKMSNLNVGANGDQKQSFSRVSDEKQRLSLAPSTTSTTEKSTKTSKFGNFKKSMGIKTSEEKAVIKAEKEVGRGRELRDAILREEQGRWPDEQWHRIVHDYQVHVGMYGKIAHLRAQSPIQYLHLLRAGYFEPIPVSWAGQASNPLKFSIEGAGGWRGITPTWRGYEDTAEERLYWVLNHREGTVGTRLKPDFISALDMARRRMASAVEPPPEYYSATDTCNVQHTSSTYSKQVMPSPFRPSDRPEVSTDDTMILLDVSGSMCFDPVRPNYNQYLITGYSRSTQPKNEAVAKAVVRRFTDAMANHDHSFEGYDLVTFSSQATYIGTINHKNYNTMWREIRMGGGTRVMTGWQKVKERHFQKHSESATYHPVYGWQAGPQTPMLRLLLLLDGEATDMDEFELDLLSLSWAHVTIFLIGVDGCPHHHRHANELQRISDVNHHVAFVDAQGNAPERFVTHELLKRHLGYEMTFSEFEQVEELPPYTE